jgi:hypothetical protein
MLAILSRTKEKKSAGAGDDAEKVKVPAGPCRGSITPVLGWFSGIFGHLRAFMTNASQGDGIHLNTQGFRHLKDTNRSAGVIIGTKQMQAKAIIDVIYDLQFPSYDIIRVRPAQEIGFTEHAR